MSKKSKNKKLRKKIKGGFVRAGSRVRLAKMSKNKKLRRKLKGGFVRAGSFVKLA